MNQFNFQFLVTFLQQMLQVPCQIPFNRLVLAFPRFRGCYFATRLHLLPSLDANGLIEHRNDLLMLAQFSNLLTPADGGHRPFRSRICLKPMTFICYFAPNRQSISIWDFWDVCIIQLTVTMQSFTLWVWRSWFLVEREFFHLEVST